MDTHSTAMLIAIILLVAMSAVFSSTETAFSSFNYIRMKNRAESGDKKAALVLKLAEDFDALLSTILVGNNVVNLTAASLSTLFFTKLLDSDAYGPAVSTAVLTVVVLVFGEISPKSLAKENADGMAMAMAPLFRVLVTVLRPVNWVFSQWKRLLDKLFHREEEDGITDEELVTMVDEAEAQGGLEHHEGELIRAAIEFNDLEVEDILTPRVDVAAVEDTATAEELAAAFAQTGYSRLPVYHESVDNITGVIHEKDFYAARYYNKTDLSQLITPVLYTTGSTKISDLIRILQGHKTHMAVVVDEYGGTDGIVTLEDILEELVGEIWDEHDEVIETFQKQPDGSYLIACSADLADLYDLFSLTGECDAATVSGWVMEQLGHVPNTGDRFTAEGLDVTVTKVDHRRVLEIRVVVLPKEESQEE